LGSGAGMGIWMSGNLVGGTEESTLVCRVQVERKRIECMIDYFYWRGISVYTSQGA